jgi:tetratricopeptide (TPR) repeat protein
MNSVKHIEIDLNTYRIVLQFQNAKAPLILHFDTPSRNFYLALIALIVHENNKQDRPGYVLMGKYKEAISELNISLSRYPKHSLFLYQSAAAYAGMENEEKAQAYASKLLKIIPSFSVSKWSKPRRQKWNPAELEKFSALLRKAGLPD